MQYILVYCIVYHAVALHMPPQYTLVTKNDRHCILLCIYGMYTWYIPVNLTLLCVLPGKCYVNYKSFSRSLSILPCILHMFHPVCSMYTLVMKLLSIFTCILSLWNYSVYSHVTIVMKLLSIFTCKLSLWNYSVYSHVTIVMKLLSIFTCKLSLWNYSVYSHVNATYTYLYTPNFYK